MDESYDCLILLAYLETPERWTESELQTSIRQIIELVNTVSDITGIMTAGLMVDMWGEDPLVSFFVQHDHRWLSPEDADNMIVDTFSKAIELCDLDEDLWILHYEERELLDGF